MQIVSLDGKMEDYFLTGEFVKVKVKGRKVKLKLALSDPEDEKYNTTFVMKFNLDKIDSFNKFCSLIEEFFYEQPLEFNAEDFLGRKCDVHLAEVYYSARTKRKLKYIKPLKSDYKGITQNKKLQFAATACSEAEGADISAFLFQFGHSQA